MSLCNFLFIPPQTAFWDFYSALDDEANSSLRPSERTKQCEEIRFICGVNDRRDGGDQVQGRTGSPLIPRGLLASLTRPPTGPITRGKTNKGRYYTLLMKGTGGGGGASWTPPEQKSLDRPHPPPKTPPPAPPLVPPHPHLHPNPPSLSQSSHFLHMRRCVTSGGRWRSRGSGGSGASWPVN